MGLSFNDLYIAVRILVADSVGVSLAGGPFLDEGPHEVVHNQELQVQLIELVNALDNLLYHELPSDLVPGRTTVRQDSRVEVASLHPALLSESIEGAIIAKL